MLLCLRLLLLMLLLLLLLSRRGGGWTSQSAVYLCLDLTSLKALEHQLVAVGLSQGTKLGELLLLLLLLLRVRRRGCVRLRISGRGRGGGKGGGGLECGLDCEQIDFRRHGSL